MSFKTYVHSFSLNIKVIAGLLVPIYIKKLDFKTRDELQQMPQTEEEHLENQYLDYEDKEKSITDAEVNKSFKEYFFFHLKDIPESQARNSIFEKQTFMFITTHVSPYAAILYLRAPFKGVRLRI